MGFLIHDRFLLGILITCCIALSGCACSLVLTNKASLGTKRSFIYMMFFGLAHETSSLLAYYTTSPDMFRHLATIKATSAYLLATAMLFFTGVYVEKRWLKRLALCVHLVSVGQVVFPLMNRPWAENLVMLERPFEAQYQDAAIWYAVAPGTLCMVLSVVIILYEERRGRKLTAASVLFAFLLLCMGTFSIQQLFVRDVLYDNMHLIILLCVLAVKLKAMPFFSRDAQYISRADIHYGFSEAVIIFDRKDHIIHIHDGLKTIKLSDRLNEILTKLPDVRTWCEPGVLSQGLITIDDTVHLQYKISPIQTNGKVIGKIINIRDVTELVNLQSELSQKNRQLELAFARKQRVVRAVRQLALEKERARILDKVNATPNAYINRVRNDVMQLEAEMASGPDFQQKVRMMNDQLLDITRSVIEEIRATVKKLNPEREGCESLEDMEKWMLKQEAWGYDTRLDS